MQINILSRNLFIIVQLSNINSMAQIPDTVQKLWI